MTTGVLNIRARAGFPRVEGITDPSKIILAVEIWTNEPIDNERGHCMEVYIPAPMTDFKYEDAYKRILGTYEDFWKSWNVAPPESWKYDLARQCGRAVSEFMKSPEARMAACI